MNGGGICANIDSGDIIAIHPYGNSACFIEAIGQEILDALELGSCSNPGGSGGFLQVSGLTYEIHSYIPSSVVLTENKEFVEVNGEYRVKNILLNGNAPESDNPENPDTGVAGFNVMLIAAMGALGVTALSKRR